MAFFGHRDTLALHWIADFIRLLDTVCQEELDSSVRFVERKLDSKKLKTKDD